MSTEVVSFTPAWQVITFRDYSHAKNMLLEKYHSRIVSDAEDLAKRYTAEQLHYIITKTIGLQTHDKQTMALLAVKDRFKLAQEIWPMLIIVGHRTVQTAFSTNVREAVLPTHITYYCDYIPGEDRLRDLTYLKLAPQARVLVDMLVEKIAPMNEIGTPEFIFLQHLRELKNSGTLVTKQDIKFIWYYYKATLLAAGFVAIKKPKK